MWMEALLERAAAYERGETPLYLTLCGAHGREIELLIENGLLGMTEVQSIAESDVGLVVAVEPSPLAVLELQRRFPGLKILNQPIQSIVRSDNPTTWPQGSDETFCRAHVINLDLDEALTCTTEGGQLRFPVLGWVNKLAQLHAASPRIDWILYLTLHGEVPWSAEESLGIQRFLVENFDLEPAYDEAARAHLGADLYELIRSDEGINWTQRARVDHQAVLMTLVPKKIAHLVHQQGWFVRTLRNIRYGGSRRHAPMCTWMFEFRSDPRAATTPTTVYRESLANAFDGLAAIAEDGTVSAA